MRLPVILLLICLVSPLSSADDGVGQPEWFRQHLAYLAAGDGTWLADNARFKSDEEPFDAYEVTYAWGPGKHTVSGSLRAHRDGEVTGVIWEYRVFWDPATGKGILQQWGVGGAYGVGETMQVDDKTLRSEQTFYGLDGSSSRIAHDWILDGPLQHITHSFSFEDGAWKAGRTYTWKRAPHESGD